MEGCIYSGSIKMFHLVFFMINFLSTGSCRVVEIQTEEIDKDIEIISSISLRIIVLTTHTTTPNVIWTLIDIQGNEISEIMSLTGKIRPMHYQRFSSTAYLDFPNTPDLVGQSVKLRVRAFYDGQKGIIVNPKGFLRFKALWKLSMEEFAVISDEMDTSCIFNNNALLVDYEINLKNSTRVKISINTVTCQVESPLYDVNITCTNTSFTLKFPEAKIEFNQSYWRCVDSLNRTRTSRFRRLEIAVLPMDVKVCPGEISVFDGSNVSLRCVSKNIGYPKPKYQWYLGGREIAFCTPNITLYLQQIHHGLTILCSMTAVQNRTKISESVPISVYYSPPGDLVMEGIEDKLYREDGQLMNITCWIPTAFPLPQMTLFCSDGSYGTTSSNTTGIGSWLMLLRDRNLNGVECICNISQDITMYADKARQLINVIYTPSVNVSSIIAENGDTNVFINCSVFANPAVSMLYWEHRVGDVLIRNQSSLQDFVHESYLHSLYFPVLSFADHGVYFCFASNGVLSTNNGHIVSGYGRLTVRVKSVFLDLPRDFEGYISQQLKIQFSFYACPLVSIKGIMIYRQDNDKSKFIQNPNLILKNAKVQAPFYGRQLRIDGQRLFWDIKELNSSYIGNYTVHLENDVGLHTSYFIVKGKNKMADHTNFSSGTFDTILKWMSPTLLVIILIGGSIFFAKRKLKNCRSLVSDIHNGDDIGEEVYSFADLPQSREDEIVINTVPEMILLAESGFVTETPERETNLSADGGNHQVTENKTNETSEVYETLLTEEKSETDEYSLLD